VIAPIRWFRVTWFEDSCLMPYEELESFVGWLRRQGFDDVSVMREVQS
jgi:hypothetical protein